MRSMGTGMRQEGRGLGSFHALLMRALIVLFVCVSVVSNFAEPSSQFSFATDIEDTQRVALAGVDTDPDADQPDLVFVIRAITAAQFQRSYGFVAQIEPLPTVGRGSQFAARAPPV